MTSHARALLIISRNPDTRVRGVAAPAGITEGSAQRIVADLDAAGYLAHGRIGRHNDYRVSRQAAPPPDEQGVEVGALLELVTKFGTGA